jgi:hypothetical protein
MMNAMTCAALFLLVTACSDDAVSPDAAVGRDAGRDPIERDGAVREDGGATADAGSSAAGFRAEPGFVVTGSFTDGGEVVVTRVGGGFGERELPWLWDTVDAQWLAGENQDAYAGLGDGQPVTTDVWTNQNIYAGWDEPEHHFAYTTGRPLRHARAIAEYANFAASGDAPEPYSKLGYPAWPDAWGAQDNAEMYLTWWQRVSGTHAGYPQDDEGNGGEDKPLRFGDTEGAGLGEFDITVAGLTGTTTSFGNVKSWGSLPDPGDRWHRIEFYLDRTTGSCDMHVDGRLSIGESWTVRPSDGGAFEFRPDGDYLYVSPATPGTELATSGWRNVTVHWLGFDDGGITQQWAPGRNVEISEIYVDVTRARLELSTASEWVDRPDAERTSEVQGRVTSWSDAEIRFVVHQGAFDELTGLALWMIGSDGAPTRIGTFE